MLLEVLYAIFFPASGFLLGVVLGRASKRPGIIREFEPQRASQKQMQKSREKRLPKVRDDELMAARENRVVGA